MGELILCSQKLAERPFYIDNASLNVYSLEELAYYIEHNYDMLGPDFMSEALLLWVEQELNFKDVAASLQKICQREGTLSEFVVCLLTESAYCTKESLRTLKEAFARLEDKSDFECGKLRADRYMENSKYRKAVCEYRKLLNMSGEEAENALLTGNVWHNLGTAYARLFLFQEAASCFHNAYALNQNMESLRECLCAYRCLSDEKGFADVSKEYCLSEEEIEEVRRSLTAASQTEEIRLFEAKLDGLCEDEIKELMDEWKKEYRKYCRV